MNIKYSLIILVFLIFPHTAFADVTLNEIMPNPEGKDAGREWIELYNNSKEEINLTDWQISTEKDFLTLENLTIKADSFLVIENSKLSLTNTDGLIHLIKNTGLITDEATYQKSQEGLSLSKITIMKGSKFKQEWTWGKPTKNEPNPFFYEIEGKIYSEPQIAEEFYFEILHNDKVKKIFFDGEIHKFEILQISIVEGAQGRFLVDQKNNLQEYEITSPPLTTSSPPTSKQKWEYYLLFPIMGLIIGLIYINRKN